MYSEMVTKDFKAKNEGNFEKTILENLKLVDLFRPDIVNNFNNLQNSFKNDYNSLFNNLNKNALGSFGNYPNNFPFNGNMVTNYDNFQNIEMNRNFQQQSQTFKFNASEASSVSAPSDTKNNNNYNNNNTQPKKNKIRKFSSVVDKPDNSDKQLLNKKVSRCFVKNGKVVFVQNKKDLLRKEEIINGTNKDNNNTGNNGNIININNNVYIFIIIKMN
jgi:hypothetical protein